MQVQDGQKDDTNVLTVPSESFFDSESLQRFWPESNVRDRVLMEQIDARMRLIDALNAVQSRMSKPDVPLSEMLDHMDVSEEQVANLYHELANLLERNPEYGRIILYMPSELLLNADFTTENGRLIQEMARFRAAYLRTWKRLLSLQDVRATFTDGDVPETEMRSEDPPRVVKVAHLIPILVQKGWLKPEAVLTLPRLAANDDVLLQSVTDALAVLWDTGLISQDMVDASGAEAQAAMANIITNVPENRTEHVSRPFDAEKLMTDMEHELVRTDVAQGKMTEKRRQWLLAIHRQRTIESGGERIGKALQDGSLAPADMRRLLNETQGARRAACIDGLRRTMEHMATSDPNTAKSLYAEHHDAVTTAWRGNDTEERMFARTLLLRLHHAGVIDDSALHALNLSVPKLAGPFSLNAHEILKETPVIDDIVDTLASDPELSQFVHPVVLLYGSKLKGYGTEQADTDLGFFIKPNALHGDRNAVRGLLRTMLDAKGWTDDVAEFWLEESKDDLAIHDFDGNDATAAESTWTHVLFGAAWYGKMDAIRALHEKILPSYFRESEQRQFGRDVRDLHVESLERDLLQYRLMHKGYDRSHTECGRPTGHHANRIDGTSAFWDSGYRHLAMKLFTQRVFLPLLQERNA